MSAISKAKEDLGEKLPSIELGWFHRYPARFPSTAALELFAAVDERLGRRPAKILDPFAGTAATLAVALQLGINSIGIEITPLGYLIGQVRLNPPADLSSALHMAEDLASRECKRSASAIPESLLEWIGINNAERMEMCLDVAAACTNPRLKNWLRVVISSALRPSSCWLPGSIKPQRDHTRTPPPIGPNIVRAARALKRDCERERGARRMKATAKLIHGDARRIPLDNNSVDAVITSPPYWDMYDYHDVHRLSYMAFRWPLSNKNQIGRRYGVSMDGVGFVPPPVLSIWYEEEFNKERSVLGRSLRLYITEMRAHFQEIKRVLRKGGVIAYAIADSRRHGKPFPLVKGLGQIVEELGFTEIISVSRTNSYRRILPAGRDASTGQFSSSQVAPAVQEHILFATNR